MRSNEAFLNLVRTVQDNFKQGMAEGDAAVSVQVKKIRSFRPKEAKTLYAENGSMFDIKTSTDGPDSGTLKIWDGQVLFANLDEQGPTDSIIEQEGPVDVATLDELEQTLENAVKRERVEHIKASRKTAFNNPTEESDDTASEETSGDLPDREVIRWDRWVTEVWNKAGYREVYILGRFRVTMEFARGLKWGVILTSIHALFMGILFWLFVLSQA